MTANQSPTAQHEQLHHPHHLPHIGARSLKTACTVALCATLYFLVDRNPTFACIGVVFGMDNGNMQTPWQTGWNRLSGNILGGLLGMGMFSLSYRVDSKVFTVFLLFLGILILIGICRTLHLPGAIQPGSVIFYIVMLNTPVDRIAGYALGRMFDTGVGVVLAVLVNALYLRRHYQLQKKNTATPAN